MLRRRTEKCCMRRGECRWPVYHHRARDDRPMHSLEELNKADKKQFVRMIYENRLRTFEEKCTPYIKFDSFENRSLVFEEGPYRRPIPNDPDYEIMYEQKEMRLQKKKLFDRNISFDAIARDAADWLCSLNEDLFGKVALQILLYGLPDVGTEGKPGLAQGSSSDPIDFGALFKLEVHDPVDVSATRPENDGLMVEGSPCDPLDDTARLEKEALGKADEKMANKGSSSDPIDFRALLKIEVHDRFAVSATRPENDGLMVEGSPCDPLDETASLEKEALGKADEKMANKNKRKSIVMSPARFPIKKKRKIAFISLEKKLDAMFESGIKMAKKKIDVISQDKKASISMIKTKVTSFKKKIKRMMKSYMTEKKELSCSLN